MSEVQHDASSAATPPPPEPPLAEPPVEATMPGRNERPLQGLLDDFRALPLGVLFPIKGWLGEQPWRLPWVQAVLFFALFPLTLSHLWGSDASIQGAAWAIGAYFALLWGYVLWLIVRPGNLKRRNLGITAAFTAVVGIALVLVLQQLPFISTLYAATDWSFSPARLIGFVLGVGIVEEGVKLLPVVWLALKLREIRTPREAAFYAGVSGLAFGVAEAVSYSINYTQMNLYGMATGQVGSGNYVVLEFLRLISLPFLHCIFSGIAGYYLGLSLLAPQRRTALLLLGLGLAALVHGVYDYLSSSWLGVVAAGVAILVFIGYIRSAEQITQHITGQDQPASQPAEEPAKA